MEMRDLNHHIRIRNYNCYIFTLLLLMVSNCLPAQLKKEKYIIKDGKMQIELSRSLTEAALDSFITKFDLFDLDLKQFIKTGSPDSLQKLGWKLEKNERDQLIISKLLNGFDHFNNPADKIIFAEKKPAYGEVFSALNNDIRYGYNNFKRKPSFLVKDSTITFFLRNNNNAKNVMLAGSFNNWDPEALAMTKTDSGWIAAVKTGPGKFWYKFIVDGDWTIDHDNTRVENDGRGNDNSVFYKPNVTFKLNGFYNAKKVFVSGSFNDWKPRELLMIKTPAGWQLPLYLAEGTYIYRFVVDGRWMTDPGNQERVSNEFDDFNSVIRLGKSYLFKLNGYTDAKQVILTGSFNNWRKNELPMTKTATGWELPYTLGPGNYEYNFIADGKRVSGSQKPPGKDEQRPSNNYVIIDPNYTFRLKGFSNAKKVFLAGDFNDWSPNTFEMKKEGFDWVLPVHLFTGKHLYKFVADEKWITDPGNKLWEQNEFSNGNSLIWFTE